MLEDKVEKSDALIESLKELHANQKQNLDTLSLTRKKLEDQCQSLKIEKSRSEVIA